MFRFLLPLTFLITACSVPSGPDRAARAVAPETSFPAMQTFDSHKPAYPSRSNRAIAQDFLDLTFRMESGRNIPVMTRFEGPVTLRISGTPPPTLQADLTALLARLRREAGIRITQVTPESAASVTVEVLPRRQMQRLVPQAACFVVPRVTSWEDFRRNRRSVATDWTTLERREQVTVFVPDDVAPQEVRDCLHEEIAQAIGPLNDLYRLPDSVFNDDNFHTVLTGFDMLMLRITYAPELQSGMSRAQVAAVLPRLLERLNPEGAFATGAPPPAPTPRTWINAIETTLGPGVSPSRRRSAAMQAIKIARSRGWQDNRLAFSLFAAGRVLAADNPERAIEAFLEAGAIYRSRRETTLQAANVATHLAVYSLSAGHSEDAIQLANSAIPVARDSQNATLLATLLMLKAEALDLAGQTETALSVRREGIGWALYGFGDERTVNKRLTEIASLVPLRLRNGEI